jgi:DNA invertase Pin-like site-specific DNA recombinase
MRNRKKAAPPPTALAALGYIRVSDPKQVEGVSLPQQRAAIRAFASRAKLPLTDILEDAGESAKTLDRPDVQELVRRLEAGEASVVIVYDLDRLSRYVPDYYELVDRVMNPRGIRLADTATGWVDTITPTGRAALGIKAVLSQFVREQTAKATRDALLHKKNEGEWLGRPPYGFAAPAEGSTQLVPIPDELNVVRKILARRRGPKPATYGRIAKELEAAGVPTRRGGSWRRSTIQRICERSEVYRPVLRNPPAKSEEPDESRRGKPVSQ